MSFRRDDDSHPPLDWPGYRSTKLRHPSQLRPLTQTETELTAPRLGDRPLGEHDHDLTVHGDGEPLGERIIVYGQVLEDGGRPVPETLVEIWQANACGRYLHAGDQHPAPAGPQLPGRRALPHRRRGPLPLHHDQARRLSVGQPPQRVAARSTSTSPSSGARSPSAS